MKVLYILNIFPKISETFILNEILQMQKNGVEIQAMAFKDEKENTVHPKAREVKVQYFSKSSFFQNIAAHFYWMTRQPKNYLKVWGLVVKHGDGIRMFFFRHLHDTVRIDRLRPNHLHAHFGDESSNMAMLAHSLSGVPFTFTTHSYDIFATKYNNWNIKSKLAKKQVTISQYNKDFIVDRLGADECDVQIIHCGIDFSKIPTAGPSPTDNRLICIARLHKEKGIDVLIRACRLLRDEGVQLECFVAGEGPARGDLEKTIRQLELTETVKLLGNQTQDEVFALLRSAKIKVLSSRSEGIPVSLMEAMACRVPVISTRICGIPELIEDGQSGFLVTKDDHETLAARIKTLLSDDGMRKRFAENGYRKVFQEFNLKTETDKLLAVWQRDTKDAR